MSALFESLYEQQNGRGLVDLVLSIGLENVLDNLTQDDVNRIVEKFSSDSDFNDYVRSISSPAPEAVTEPSATNPTNGYDLTFETFFNMGSGAELVALLRTLDLSDVVARLTESQVNEIVAKFSSDPVFAQYVAEVTAPVTPFPDLPVLVPDVVLPKGEALEALVEAAMATGQGQLYQSPTGFIFNQYGEQMVLDSSGRLAPAPRDVPVGMMRDSEGNFVPDPAWSAPVYSVSPIGMSSTTSSGAASASGSNSPTQPSGGSGTGSSGANANPPAQSNSNGQVTVLPEGDDLNELINYAQGNGQGTLYYNSSSQLVNQYGEIMVLDAAGNLAPAARDIPVGMVSDGQGGFVSDPTWQQPTYDETSRADVGLVGVGE